MSAISRSGRVRLRAERAWAISASKGSRTFRGLALAWAKQQEEGSLVPIHYAVDGGAQPFQGMANGMVIRFVEQILVIR